MSDAKFNVGYRIIKYYLWHRYLFKKQVEKEKKNPSYQKLKRMLKEFEQEKPLLQQQKLPNCTFTIFDLETTGFFPEIGDEIVSIGAVKMQGEKLLEQKTFYEVINPLQTVSAETKQFTGLKRKDFIKAKTLPVGLKEFLDFCKGTILVAHPASFDINFLQKRIGKWDLPAFDPEFIDSYALTKELLGVEECYLDDLVKRFHINKRARHHALNDAIMTAEIFQKLLKLCKEKKIDTIKDLHEVAGI
ncbi:3'-5' exonuclease [Rossellomorea vietnamensis]|uniref:3'-5' exonuclease n=1 Tax=Rossellomorea vietnamensis TaxID=218284 RepID=A0A5D4MI95_9BACI|nr:3'-5' exonuclease [Rossellomorea vietnamensis]TYS01473.1 3'-5' exonuclease [Rossellomorea vietnamensis]